MNYEQIKRRNGENEEKWEKQLDKVKNRQTSSHENQS